MKRKEKNKMLTRQEQRKNTEEVKRTVKLTMTQIIMTQEEHSRFCEFEGIVTLAMKVQVVQLKKKMHSF